MNKLKEMQSYMSDFAQLLVELDNIKKRIEYVESILPRINATYFDLISEKNVIHCKHGCDWHENVCRNCGRINGA